MDPKSVSFDLLDSLENDENEFELGNGFTSTTVGIDTEMPTLESILNEKDSDDETIGVDMPTEIDESELRAELESLDISSTNTTASKSPQSTSINGIACKHTILTQISAQLSNASDRGDAGLPTALAIAQYIAIGTSRGLILLFDSLQLLKHALKSEINAISALAFNTDSSRILAGNARGLIFMYDTSNGKLLRTISDAHPLGNPVLCLKFTDNPKLALFSDSGGSVFTLDFKRKMGVRSADSNCIFSGSRGEVITFEPLRFHKFYESLNVEPTAKKTFEGLNLLFNEFTFVAMASFTRLFIVVIKPEMKVLFVHPLSGNSSYLPILAWQFVIIQSQSDSDSKQRIINPIIAYARESTIQFIQIHYYIEKNANLTNGNGLRTSGMDADSVLKFKFLQLRKNEFSFKIFNFGWLNAKTLAVMDHRERLHIVDIRTNEVIQMISLDCVQLVYSSAFFKGVATGGFVSKALAVAGENACYQSFFAYMGQLFILGRRSVHLFALQSWNARIDDYVNEGKLDEALLLTIAIYENRTKALIGLPVEVKLRQEKIVDKLIDLIYLYINRALKQDCPKGGKIELLEKHYREVSLRCVQLCLAVHRLDLLFTSIYDMLSVDQLVEGFFFESLEESILRDEIKLMPAAIAKRFIEYYVSKGFLSNIERCIVHFDVSCLDLHQVSQVCRTHRLLDALIYISNKALGDYLTPINELLELMRPLNFLNSHAIVSNSDDSIVNFGNKLMVYLHCCLVGQAYPYGLIDDSVVDTVRRSTFQYLIEPKNKFISELIVKEDLRELVDVNYPLLRIFINFNLFDFLNVIAMAFNEQSFDAVMGLDAKQQFIDILIEIMLKNEAEFSIAQLGVLFTFFARQIANRNNNINIDLAIFRKIMKYLCMGKQMDRFEEREQTLIALLGAFNASIEQFYPMDELVMLVRDAKFYRAAEILYELKGDYHEIVECYLNDEVPREKKMEIFVILKKLIDGLYKNGARRKSFMAANRDIYLAKLTRKLLKASILRELVQIDARETVYMLWIEMNIDLKEIVCAARAMNTQSDSENDELKDEDLDRDRDKEDKTSLKRVNSSSSFSAFSMSDYGGEPFELFYVFMKGLFDLVDIIKSNKKYIHYMSQFSSEYIEIYVEQMCVFESAKVMHYLKAAASEFSYRTEECLRICRERRVWDATAFLLEKSGQIEAAFAIHLEKLDALIKQLEMAYESENERDIDVFQMKIASLLVLIVELCQRGSCMLNDAIKEKIWFSLFDHVMLPLRTFLVPELKHLGNYSPVSAEISVKHDGKGVNLKLFEHLTEFFKKQGSYIINSMLGYINLGVVIDKVISDSSHNITKFGDIKQLILKMIEVYNYEKTLLDKTSSLVSRDVHRQLVAFKKVCSRSFAPIGNCCQYCAKSLTEQELSFLNDNSVSSIDAFASSSIQLFHCGHSYHRVCLESINRLMGNCPECFPTTKNGKSEMAHIGNINNNSSNANNNSTLNTSEVSVKSLASREAEKHEKYQSLSVSFTPSYSVNDNSGLSEQQVNALKTMRTRTTFKSFFNDNSNSNASRFTKSSPQQNISLAPANIAKFI